MRFRSTVKRVAGLALLALVASAVLSACDKSPSILQPEGPVADQEQVLAYIVFGIAAFIFVVVTSTLIYFIIRFRDRPNAPEASQLHGNSRLEIGWTIAPSVVLVILLFITISTMFSIASPPQSDTTINITAIGHQWWWEFDYQGQNVVTADELHVPVNTAQTKYAIHVDLRSNNVIHSLWIPQLAGKTDVIPGHNNAMWFSADQTGTYRGECTEFCGAQHAHMDFVVVVQSLSDYNAWIAQQQQLAATPAAGSQAALGLAVFKSAGCQGCHAINGVSPAGVNGLIGPNLTHFGSRLLIAGGVLDNNPANLMQWIWHAQTVKEGVDMPSFDGSTGPQYNISQDDLNNLVAYLESLQ